MRKKLSIKNIQPGWLLIVVLMLPACSEETTPLAMPPGQRHYESAQLQRGEEIFNQHCASCHGQDAVGDPNWRQQGSDGRFPPPPLNGSAHTWHHPLAQLRHTIKNGGPVGKSNMPAWKETLSDQQIDDVIAWFQSLWSEEVYRAWYDMEQRTQ